MRSVTISAATLLIAATVGCGGGPSTVAVPGREGGRKSTATVRAERRAYDGAPPTIPHEDFGIECDSCHNVEGMDVPGVGFAPPAPHAETAGLSEISRCVQCHVFHTTDAVFVSNGFAGLRQDLRHGDRLREVAPPTIPHKVFMRENCRACHTGVAAREEIRTSHPERIRCRQCHVEVTTRATFEPQGEMP